MTFQRQISFINTVGLWALVFLLALICAGGYRHLRFKKLQPFTSPSTLVEHSNSVEVIVFDYTNTATHGTNYYVSAPEPAWLIITNEAGDWGFRNWSNTVITVLHKPVVQEWHSNGFPNGWWEIRFK